MSEYIIQITRKQGDTINFKLMSLKNNSTTYHIYDDGRIKNFNPEMFINKFYELIYDDNINKEDLEDLKTFLQTRYNFIDIDERIVRGGKRRHKKRTHKNKRMRKRTHKSRKYKH
jgi:hypothetical protein